LGRVFSRRLFYCDRQHWVTAFPGFFYPFARGKYHGLPGHGSGYHRYDFSSGTDINNPKADLYFYISGIRESDFDPCPGESGITWKVQTFARVGIAPKIRRNGTIEQIINVVLLGFLAATAVAIAQLRSLFAAAMLFGIYSLLSAGIFVGLDAVDVAFTEAAVGGGISTILMLGALSLIGKKQEAGHSNAGMAVVIVTLTGAMLIYGTLDFPGFGHPEAPVHQHVAPRYIEQSPQEVGVPNMVTSVLASYRGYDTLGEVAVIFTAGIGVLTLLSGRRRHKKKNPGS